MATVPGAPLVPRPLLIKEKVYGEISLSRAISLLLGLQNQVIRLERELKEIKEVNKEAQDWMGAVDQTLTCIEVSGGPQPHTPEDRKPPAVEATPRPIPKADPLPAPSAPLLAWANPIKPPITFAQPTPVRAPPRVHTPAPPTPIRLQSPLAPQPAAPIAAYQAPVKVDHPDAYTGKIGNESRQWLTRMMAWVRLNNNVPHGSGGTLVPPDEHEGRSRSMGTPPSHQLGTIAMDLDWNDAALRGQFARGLHWEVSRLIATRERRPTTLLELQNAALVIDNALREERASHPPKGNNHKTRAPLQHPNYVSEEERNRRRAEGLCIKCGKTGHKFAECRTGWKATPKEEGVKKEAAKVGKESGPESGKD
ncbi:hypothetical protein RHS01_06465 [Rhizoctonia solani]|uniref:CCHC-type domain-containing protein n=1 Tax=Rhizoctonia solani TaxID=456999 RepID=A0A8H7IC34_9AGAM|nr:hypothetical protein RHS01_06465 [Rhizoctonia solani]